jgi:predicted restriction endonuclease
MKDNLHFWSFFQSVQNQTWWYIYQLQGFKGFDKFRILNKFRILRDCLFFRHVVCMFLYKYISI